MVVVQIDFDERDPLYGCCFDKIRIRNGARVLAAVNALMGVYMTIEFIFFSFNPFWMGLQILHGIIQTVTSVLMIVAVQLTRSKLVIPYLVAQLLMVLMAAAFFVLFCLSIYLPYSIGRAIFDMFLSLSSVDVNPDDTDAYIEAIMLSSFYMTFVCFIVFCFEAWTLRVSFQCYNYLLDVRDAREGTNRLPPLRMERTRGEEISIVGVERITAVYNPVSMRPS